MTITEIRAVLDNMEAVGAPQWKRQLAFESMQADRERARAK